MQGVNMDSLLAELEKHNLKIYNPSEAKKEPKHAEA
jgi:hypothetical protein